jgi:DNA-directed RNA polymerase I subunit RPA12
MSVVGSLIFCLDCGNLLDSVSGKDHITCSDCQRSYESKQFSNLKVVTRSADDAFPSSLRLKQSVVKTVLKSDELEEGATIKEKCPQCGNEEMQYHTLQLRSADEGATVFYTCTGCGYRFRTNN